MSSVSSARRGPRVAVVGGGLSGLAAAAALCDAGLHVELFESRRRLGGRAGSFRDSTTGEWIDHCQHVGMGCCTNLADFCRRTGLFGLLRRDDRLYFFGPDGKQIDFAASGWLPAPFHLGPALMRLTYLPWRDRVGIALAMLRLARLRVPEAADSLTIGEWLRAQGQSPAACRDFWGVVLVSALGETLDRASLRYARKVFVDGFMANRHGWEVDIPRVPLGDFYGERLQRWFAERGAVLHVGTPVQALAGDASSVRSLQLAAGDVQGFDAFVMAVPWRLVRGMLTVELDKVLHSELASIEQIEAAPITGVHLWFDRPITGLPHAVLVGRLSQWLFNRSPSLEIPLAGRDEAEMPSQHYYQVVISASRELAGQDREQVVRQIHQELASSFPIAATAKLLRWRLVTEPMAVFSPQPGIDRKRPQQQTAISNLALAGDWTDTGWPATMEGAVRSGYLAAEAVLAAVGQPRRIVCPDLPRSILARLVLGAS